MTTTLLFTSRVSIARSSPLDWKPPAANGLTDAGGHRRLATQ